MKNIKGQEIRGYESTDLSETNLTFYRELKLNTDSETSTGFFEYSISDDSSSHRTAMRRNKKILQTFSMKLKNKYKNQKMKFHHF